MKFAFFILYLIQLLPLRAIHAIAFVVGRIAYLFAKERRYVGAVNLKLCLPELSDDERKKILKANFVQMACLLFEYGICWYSSVTRLNQLVKEKNRHFLDDAMARGEKIILMTPHFCAFEIGMFKVNQTVKILSVYSQQKNAAMDKRIYDGRMRFNNAHIISRQANLRTIIRAIKEQDAAFVYLPDQDFGPKDSIFVNFFHTPAATITGLSRIAKLTKATIIPMITHRNKDGFVTEFYEPWADFPSEDDYLDAQRMNDFIETEARKTPEQYFWLHKRFKTRPEGEKSLY